MSGRYQRDHAGSIAVDQSHPLSVQPRKPLIGQCNICPEGTGIWQAPVEIDNAIAFLADELRYHLTKTHGIQPLPKERSEP